MRPKYSTLPSVRIAMEDEVATLSPAFLSFIPAFMSFSNHRGRWMLPGALLDYAYPDYPAAYSFTVEQIGVGQFTTARDELWRPLYNIQGDEIFRRLDYADDTNSGTIVWSYRFDAAASSVTTLRTVTGVDGPPTNSPTSATQATIWGDDDDGNPIVKGNVTLSLKSDFEYLDETLETYFSQARTWKRGYATGGDGYYGLATRSHSPGGPRCISGGAEIFAQLTLRGNIIDGQGTPETEDDVISRYGYELPFRAITQIVRRQNAPYITDLGDDSGPGADSAGVDVYRFGNAERKLNGVIGERKWKDSLGIYDRRTSEALGGVGHGYAPNAVINGLLPTNPIDGLDNTAEAMFASCDGMSYRLTIEAGVETSGPGGVFTAIDTRTVTVLPGAGVVFAYSAYIATANKVQVKKLEVLVGGVYEEVTIQPGTPIYPPRTPLYATFTGGTFSSTPDAGCRVLVLLRRRAGERWGYGEYTQIGVGSYGDYDTVPYFSEQLTTLDFATDPSLLGSVDVGDGADVSESEEPTKGRIAGSGGNIPRLAITKDKAPININSGSIKGSNAARANGAVTNSNRTGYGTPITSGGAGNGTPITSGGAGNGAPITSGGAGNGNAITSGGAGRGKPITSGGAGNGTPFGTRTEGNDLSSGSGRAGIDADFDLGNSQLDLGSGLQFANGLESSYDLGNSRLQSGSGLQFGGGLESNFNLGNSRLQFGRGLQSGGGLQFGRGLQTGGQLGDRRGNSGAIARSNLNGLRNKGLGATSGNAGAVSKSNLNGLKGKPLGTTSGNAGAISRSNLNGTSGGLGSRSGNSGAIKRNGSSGKSLGSTSKVGGGKSSSSREKKSRAAPVFVFREFGEPVSGTLKLTKTESFDLETAEKLPAKVTTWRAMLNGSDWTPELGTDFADRYYNAAFSSSMGATTQGYSLDPDGIAIPYSSNCEIRYDFPDRTGRELKRETVDLPIPNTLESDAWLQDPPTPNYLGPSPSNFHTVKNPQRGTTVWPEPLIILP